MYTRLFLSWSPSVQSSHVYTLVRDLSSLAALALSLCLILEGRESEMLARVTRRILDHPGVQKNKNENI